eukprot:Blabericola_migrator_1__2851@NODE_1816_length_3743_cov_264_731230_g1166_i0_p2_GENE_NODE_1816_length_3743_cov_264_731230_g1166_i0NODE_1816_length_3743_cov_264_731230_g1166_i0_p2_ORF_typecomplete_len303_score19_22Acyl_transf_3/PF01757_22/2e07DUF5509/PF17625_2/0_026DUF1275/PF06912_11/2_9e02DUF1275/PF06912_11/0_14DUF2173/PF09941_9/0_14_NODE_1816_length_3743_cov_264_731230_g1166_i02581166
MKARNSEIEGARFFLSATVLQYHLMAAYWKDMHDKSGWLAVNGFFVISAILAATSLESSWNRWQTRKASLQIEDATEKWMQKMSDAPTVSHDGTKVWFKRSLVTRFLCQYFDFLITRIPPFLWIAWANIIVLSPYDPLPVWRRMFDPAAFPLTNYWGLGLQGDGKHHNYYVPNPVFWYLCSLVLFLLGAPIFFHIFRVLKKVPLPVYFKGVVFFTLPFAICVLDYYAIRALSFPDLMCKDSQTRSCLHKSFYTHDNDRFQRRRSMRQPVMSCDTHLMPRLVSVWLLWWLESSGVNGKSSHIG